MTKLKKALIIILALVCIAGLIWLALSEDGTQPTPDGGDPTGVVKGQRYTSRDEVAEYLHLYGELPPNYITKGEAGKLGWVSSEGNLWQVTDRMSIGGDTFTNREGTLPKADGRRYYECDIDYEGGYRGAKRIVYSSDGLIYYTDDHYETFTQITFDGD